MSKTKTTSRFDTVHKKTENTSVFNSVPEKKQKKDLTF